MHAVRVRDASWCLASQVSALLSGRQVLRMGTPNLTATIGIRSSTSKKSPRRRKALPAAHRMSAAISARSLHIMAQAVRWGGGPATRMDCVGVPSLGLLTRPACGPPPNDPRPRVRLQCRYTPTETRAAAPSGCALAPWSLCATTATRPTRYMTLSSLLSARTTLLSAPTAFALDVSPPLRRRRRPSLRTRRSLRVRSGSVWLA